MVTIKANFKPRRSARRIARLNRLLMVVLGAGMVFTLISFGLVVQVKSLMQSEQSQAKVMAEVNNNLLIEQHRATSFEKMMDSRGGFPELSEPTSFLTVVHSEGDSEHAGSSDSALIYPVSYGY